METKSKSTVLIGILIIIALGIWVIVLQNAGIIRVNHNVYVNGGNIDADVKGSVSVDNTIDINVKAINGRRDAFYGPNKDGGYDAIHVYTGR